MAPRRRQAAPSAGAAAASLASLPDALLERILGSLNFIDRHRAALVSRRWHAAAHAPDAVQNIRWHCPSLKLLQSLSAWLRRHRQHVRSFDVSCYPSSSEAQPCAWELAAGLGLLSAEGALHQLTLQFGGAGTGLLVTSWCAALRQLRSLNLRARYPNNLRISSSLAGLTALTRLVLVGAAVELDGAAELPPNVERLRLSDTSGAALPPQLSGLTRLSLLVLSTGCTSDGFAVLTSLGRLSRLLLESTDYLPACLPQLTGLSELKYEDAGLAADPAAAQVAIEAALQPLTGLTSLCILDEAYQCQPPASLTALSSLQRLCLGGTCYNPVEQQEPPVRLPPGPWAASLRELGASLDVLPHSLQLLRAATQLTRLVLSGSSFGRQDQDAFWEWAGSHPSLRQLQIEVRDDTDLPGGTVHAICSLACSRPELRVTTELWGEGEMFYEEFAPNFHD